LVDKALRGRLRCIGPGRNWWSCVHVEDLGRAYAAALTTAAPGSYYAVAGSELGWHPAHPSSRRRRPDNREIAAHRSLSPRTVECHLGKVFTKLRIASRTELIRPRPASAVADVRSRREAD
jgi:hypothetical protein